MSSDSNIYIKTIETDSELGAFEITGTGATSLITPNPTKSGYSPTQTSFVVGSDQLDDYSSTTDKDTRMLFDKIKGAFRAGTVESTQWDSASRGTNSAALGLNNIASGANSFAAGSGNTASGINTVALGLSNTVDNTTAGTTAIAIGSGNTIPNTSQWGIAIGKDNTTSTGNTPILIGVSNTNGSNHTSIAIGQQNQSTGTNSVAIGNYNTSTAANTFTGGNACNATNTNAVAIGQYCNASGQNSTSIGYGINATRNTASGTGSVAIGYANTSSSTNSVAIGTNCIASDQSNAVAIGNYCTASYTNSFAIGYGTSGERNIASAEGSFAIGYGCVASTTNSICMGYKASVDVLTGSGGGQTELGKVRTFFWNGDNAAKSYSYNDGSACFRVGMNSEFRIQRGGAATDELHTTWSGVTSGWTASCDINKKENLIEQNYTDILDKIMEMPVYTYNYKTVDPSIKCFGPVAQDFNRLFPSNVDQLCINSSHLSGITLSGVKGVKLGLDNLSESVDSRFASNSDTTSALQSRIAVLESSLVSTSTQIAAMESRLAALEAP